MRRAPSVIVFILLAGVALATPRDLTPWQRPSTIPFPADSPYHPGIAALGRMLFFDPRLSGAQNMSCATCHNPSFGWEAPVDLAIGAANQPLGRHAPTTLNLAWGEDYFWDGRSATLEDQARGPITAEVEMNARMADVVARLQQVPDYAAWFDRLFPDQGMTEATILRAIATFERTIVSGIAPFDRWVAGQDDAITPQAQHGFDLFVGRAGCAGCHSGWNFTDNAYHDIGLPTGDPGRAAVTGDVADTHAFKTPGLRNITLRAPYMHNGSVATLEDVVRHYAGGGIVRPSLSPLMNPAALGDDDVAAIIAFLETLTEDETHISTPILPAN